MPHIYEIKRFLSLVKDKYIIDYDGIGYFGDQVAKKEVIKSIDVPAIRKGMKTYTHVHWYNR